MVRVNFLLFGYRKIIVEPEDVKAILSLLLHNRITVSSSPSGVMLISERDFTRVKDLLSEYKYEASEILGVLGYIKRIKYKLGLTVGVIFSLIMVFILSNLVWDIRIDGNSALSDTEIRKTLSECGFDIGSFWFTVDRSKVENTFLTKSEKLAWININRRGSVAYIEVIEADDNDEENIQVHIGYANIVASESSVIEEITVKHGTAMVKPGDTVKKGDILISGVMESGGFCYAEGTVTGRISETVSVDIDRNYEKRIKHEEVPIGATIKIFNLPVNIFKKYGNSYSGCDIIEDVKVFSLFGKEALPVSVIKRYAVRYEYVNEEYTDQELVTVASAKLRAKTLSALCGADLLRIKTYGEFTDSGYTMASRIVFLEDIGEILEFKTE